VALGEVQGWTRETLGIVGLGPIGADVARVAAGIGMNLLAWTRNPSPERVQYGLRLVSLEELFSAADRSVHLSLNPDRAGRLRRE
jgi:D-3-phosphoglycerate dehydrogenase